MKRLFVYYTCCLIIPLPCFSFDKTKGTEATSDYKYTKPTITSFNQGWVMGSSESLAYRMLRGEDINFLTEAYTEMYFTINRGIYGLPLDLTREKPELPKYGQDSYPVLYKPKTWMPYGYIANLTVNNTSKEGFITVDVYRNKKTGVVKTEKKSGTFEWLKDLFPSMNDSSFIAQYLKVTPDYMELKLGTRPKLKRMCKYYEGLISLHKSRYVYRLMNKGICNGNPAFGGERSITTNMKKPKDIESVTYDSKQKKWLGYKTESTTPDTVTQDRKFESNLFYESGYSAVEHRRAFGYNDDKGHPVSEPKKTDVNLKDYEWTEKQSLSGEAFIKFGDTNLLEYGECNHLKNCELYGLLRVNVLTNEFKANNGETNFIRKINTENYYIVKIPTNEIDGIKCASIYPDPSSSKMVCKFTTPIKEVFKRAFPLVKYDKTSAEQSRPTFSPEEPSLKDKGAAGTTSHQYDVHTVIELMDVLAIFEMRYRTKMPLLESTL